MENDDDADKLPIASVAASGYQKGNPPQNTLDGNLGTRWSAYGDGHWIEYDLGAIAKVSYIKIAWFRGDKRKAAFDVLVSNDGSNWDQVYNGQSSGKTVELEAYDFNNVSARFVKIVGHCNTSNDWNSITEVEIYGKKDADKLPISSVSASSFQQGNPPENSLDGDLGTRWTAFGDGEWIVYDLGAAAQVSYVMIAWYRGDIRIAVFDVEVSNDGANWRQVYSGESSGTTLDLQPYDFADTTARYVRINGYGNSQNGWNSITEVEIYGKKDTFKLPVSSLTASKYQEGNPPENTLDGDLGTRWSALGDGEWIEYDLGAAATVDYVQIAWYRGDRRSASFDLHVSIDNVVWREVYSGASSGTTVDLEAYDINDTRARFVRIIGYGNTSNGWNSITEVEIYGR